MSKQKYLKRCGQTNCLPDCEVCYQLRGNKINKWELKSLLSFRANNTGYLVSNTQTARAFRAFTESTV